MSCQLAEQASTQLLWPLLLTAKAGSQHLPGRVVVGTVCSALLAAVMLLGSSPHHPNFWPAKDQPAPSPQLGFWSLPRVAASGAQPAPAGTQQKRRGTLGAAGLRGT